MYLGLLNLSILLIFGIAGLTATFSVPGGRLNQLQQSRTIRYEDLTVPASLIADRDVGEYVRQHLNLAAVEWTVQRDPDHNLQFNYYTHNGPRSVTLLEKENRLRIATTENLMWYFFDNLHATSRRDASDWRVRLWAFYNEVAIWALITMALSGLYLWLASRPKYRWAWVSFLTGSGTFAVLYVLTR